MLKTTPKKRVLFVRRTFPVLLALFGVFSCFAVNLHSPKLAYASSADTVNFQARLQTSSGAIVPDGYYNVEFKLYSAPSGGSALWTEDYTSTSGPSGADVRLEVKDGYLSTALGSINPFGTNIDWSQQLYLTMNIGGTSGSVQGPSVTHPTGWDGEMDPRLALTSTPYAFQAGQAAQAGELSTTSGSNVSTLSIQGSTSGDQTFVIQNQGAGGTYNILTTPSGSDGYVKLQTGTPSQQTGLIDVSGAVTAGSISTSNIDTASAGTISIGGSTATGVSLGNTNNSSAITSSILIATSTGAAQTVTIGSTAGSSTTTIQGGTGGISLATGPGSGTTGSVSIITGNSSGGTAGNVTVDTGAGVISGTPILTDNFESTPSDDMTCTSNGFGCNSALSSTFAHGGTHSLAVSETAQFWAIADDYMNLTVTPGHEYNITAWFRGTHAETLNGTIFWGGSTTTSSALTDITDTTTGWTEMSGDFVAPAGMDQAYVQFGSATGASGNTTYVDDFVIQDVSSITTPYVNIGTTNAEAVTVGNTNQLGKTSIVGGGGGVYEYAGQNATVNIGTENANDVNIGNSSGTVAIQGGGATAFQVTDSTSAAVLNVDATTDIVQINAALDTIANNNLSIGSTNATGVDIGNTSVDNMTTIYGSGLVKSTAGNNTTTAFQVQNSSGYGVLTTDTSSGLVTLGTASHVNGTLVFNNSSNSNTIELLSGVTAANGGSGYTLTLPTSGASGTQCVESTSGSTTAATTLQFSTCGGSGINNQTTLQSGNFFVQAATSGSVAGILQANSAGSGDILDLKNGSGIAVATFSSTGSVLIKPSTDSPTAFQIQSSSSGVGLLVADTQNSGVSVNSSATTTNAFSVAANNLTTGNGVSIASTSAVQSAGSLLNVSDTATISTSAVSGSLVNISRSLTANVSSAGTPTLDGPSVAKTFNQNGLSSSLSYGYTVSPGHNNYYLLVTIFDDQSQGSPTVTYAGVTMTNLGHTGLGTGSNGFNIYGLKAPATGTNKLVITGNPQGEFTVLAEDYYNVNQTTPFGTFSSAHGNSGAPSLTATSANNRVVADMVASTGTNASSMAPTQSGQTQVVNGSYTGNAFPGGTNGNGIAASYRAASSSTTAVGWSNGTGWWAEAAVDLEGTTNGAQSVSSAVASYSDNCTNTSGSCANGSSVLSLNEQYSGATGAVLQIQNSGTGDMINLSNGSGTVARISNSGAATFQNSSNTTSAFQIQNSSANTIFNVDTTNGGAVTITNTGSTSSPAITEVSGVRTDADGTGLTALSVSPTTVGDVLMLAVDSDNASAITGISGGGVSTWQFVGIDASAPGEQLYIYMGRITSAGTSAVSLTFAGPTSSVWTEIAADEFTSAYGANTAWSAITSGTKANASSGTLTFPSLTTTQAKQMYWGYGFGSNAEPSSGSSTGFSYATTGGGNEITWNSNTNAITGYQPTAPISPSGTSYAIGAIISATPSGSALNVNGSSIVSASSTAALQVNNASGSSLLTADTQDGYVIIGKGAIGDANPDLLILDSSTTGTEPLEVNGGMYYNSSLGQFRCGINGSWTSCVNGTVATLTTTAGGSPTTSGTYTGNFNVTTANAIFFAPLYIPGPMTINELRVGVANATASRTGDIGIYNSSGQLVLNGGASSLDVSSTGLKTITPQQTGAARNLPAGQYYMALTLNGTTSNLTFNSYQISSGSAGTLAYMGTYSSFIGGTTLPSSVTLSNIATGSFELFMGVSN